MPMPSWVIFPSGWVRNGGLQRFRWNPSSGSTATAALMLLAVIAHHADPITGKATITYDHMHRATGLSRLKISAGLRWLEHENVLEPASSDRRSTYAIAGYAPARAFGGWAKLPAKRMYNAAGNITAFQDFKLRSRVELDAMKLYFLFAAFRDGSTNVANLSYERITQYTGIERNSIKPALSFLAANVMVAVDQLQSSTNEHGVSNTYRVIGIDPNVHRGTRGRMAM